MTKLTQEQMQKRVTDLRKTGADMAAAVYPGDGENYVVMEGNCPPDGILAMMKNLTEMMYDTNPILAMVVIKAFKEWHEEYSAEKMGGLTVLFKKEGIGIDVLDDQGEISEILGDYFRGMTEEPDSDEIH